MIFTRRMQILVQFDRGYEVTFKVSKCVIRNILLLLSNNEINKVSIDILENNWKMN